MTNNKHIPRGFTLVETLIAILILTVAIAAPLTIAQKSLQLATTAHDQLTALYLGQDAMEGVRFLRDTSKLKGSTFASFLVMMTPCMSPNAACYFGTQVYPITPVSCTVATCTDHPMYYNSANGSYNFNNSFAKTPFSRAVTIVSPSGGNSSEALVTVTVTWTDSASRNTHSVVLTDNLFDWQ